MVGSWLRRVRWSATASALAAVVAVFGATALASSVMAERQPAVRPPAAASLAAVTSARPAGSGVTVTTSSAARRPVRTTTTTTTTPPSTTSTTEATTTSAAAAEPVPAPAIVSIEVGASDVAFATAAPCDAVSWWRVPRVRPEATVVVSDDGQRIEERDAATGDVVGVLATWDEAAGRPTGTGVVEASTPGGCAPEDPAEDAPTSTTVG